MKKYIYLPALLAITLISCKEVPIKIGVDPFAKDSTYLSGSVEPEEVKNFLIEEYTGVKCTNCPAGAVALEELNAQNDHRFRIVAHHEGNLADPIANKSIQDFRTDDGKQIIKSIFNEQGSKPTVAFDRLPIGGSPNKYLVDGKDYWPNAIARMKSLNSTTPVNIKVTSKYNDMQGQYDIEAIVHYTKATSGNNRLHLFLIESEISDAFISTDTFITYDHVFRKSVTPVTGNPILDSFATKEAGRVYIYRTSVKIDKTDTKQKAWNPEHMKVVAFVSVSAPGEQHVLQVEEAKLK